MSEPNLEWTYRGSRSLADGITEYYWTCQGGHFVTLGTTDRPTSCPQCEGLASLRADKARLDWLQCQSRKAGVPDRGWIARNSTQGRGYRLHETSQHGHAKDVRAAIDKAMFRGVCTTIDQAMEDHSDG